jgi:AraC-like DNA-binding protein
MTACAIREDVVGDVAHTVPFFLVSQLVDLVGRWRISEEELLSETGLAENALEDPFGRFPLSKMCELLERARLLTGEAGLGYYDGLQKPPSAYGPLGLAALSATSVREALELAVTFAPLFSTALSLDVRFRGDVAIVHLAENADLGTARDIVLISMGLRLQTIFNALTKRRQHFSADLAIAEPPYQSRFAHLVPRWRFGQVANRAFLDATAIDAPIATADRTGLRVARTLCERALDELGFEEGFVDRVRRLLAKEEGGFRSVDEVAARMHVSGRTLKRRLAAQGVSFSNLTERTRLQKAMVLLRSCRLPVSDIAHRLDYATTSTFVRAFHRWTGTTPAAYRRRV